MTAPPMRWPTPNTAIAATPSSEDALRRGWPREAERHGAIANRLNQLLNDLAPQTDP